VYSSKRGILSSVHLFLPEVNFLNPASKRKIAIVNQQSTGKNNPSQYAGINTKRAILTKRKAIFTKISVKIVDKIKLLYIHM
jgi:hypothetical protein